MLAPVVLLVLLASQGATGDLADVDQADLNSDSSGTRGMDNHLEGGEGSDPNLVNPQKGQGYGLPIDSNVLNNPWKGTTQVTTLVETIITSKYFSNISSRTYLKGKLNMLQDFLLMICFLAKAPRRTSPPTPKRTFSEQSLRAVLELGIIVSLSLYLTKIYALSILF